MTAPTEQRTTATHALVAGTAVPRLAFGAARLTAGDGWGAPVDPAASIATVHAALDAGIRLFDTADTLGPGVSESLLGEALAGLGDEVVVATKAGMVRSGPRSWGILGRPDYLKQQAYTSLLRLGRERIDLFYLHRIDPSVPVADQIGALQELRAEGVIDRIGVSEPTLAQLEEVLALEPLSAVQSHLNVAQRDNLAVLTRTTELGIPFVAYWPLAGNRIDPQLRQRIFAALEEAGTPVGASGAQLALLWLLVTSDLAIPLAGSRSPQHLRANAAALDLLADPAVVAVARDLPRLVDAVTAAPAP